MILPRTWANLIARILRFKTRDYEDAKRALLLCSGLQISDLEDELEMAGLDIDELSDMDEDERREALEDAGLDPDDYGSEF